ncbi:LacI family DNA-binding transcriptional regulator [Paratractidigestivibacter sp.]|uniref:LacI family DNA-binding transcriptional regulator n=1 Tax=Paratractidigestivibacter sp. TaxID=2847316 RepID=UPI002ABD71A6|nr:LacI family DNA-binding transcriptional regulator [Paratractidigestivibacter sp.]
MAKVTLKDIAREVGLSPTAVSLVLNDRSCKISAESRARIKEVARKKRYIPNQIARSLVTQHSQTLGLIVPNIESRFFSSLAHHLEVACRKRGYLLLIANSDDSTHNDADLIRLFVNRGVDGIFIVVADELRYARGLKSILEQLPVSFVMVDRFIEGLDCDRVGFNNEQGGYLATSYLLGRGHERVAAIINKESNTGLERMAGYERALREHGIEPDPELELHSAYYIDDAFQSAKGILKTDATAVFASSDNIALGLLKLFYANDLRVPRDYSVVSYDNSAADTLFEPALTSIEQNSAELAAAALELMFARLAEDSGADRSSSVTRILRPKIIVKDSVRWL